MVYHSLKNGDNSDKVPARSEEMHESVASVPSCVLILATSIKSSQTCGAETPTTRRDKASQNLSAYTCTRIVSIKCEILSVVLSGSSSSSSNPHSGKMARLAATALHNRCHLGTCAGQRMCNEQEYGTVTPCGSSRVGGHLSPNDYGAVSALIVPQHLSVHIFRRSSSKSSPPSAIPLWSCLTCRHSRNSESLQPSVSSAQFVHLLLGGHVLIFFNANPPCSSPPRNNVLPV